MYGQGGELGSWGKLNVFKILQRWGRGQCAVCRAELKPTLGILLKSFFLSLNSYFLSIFFVPGMRWGLQ